MRHLFLITLLCCFVLVADLCSAADVPEWLCGASRFQENQINLFNRLGAGDTYTHASAAGTAMAGPLVGDRKQFWVWDLTVMPPDNIQIWATCQVVGTHCYIFVEDTQWGVNVDSADVNKIRQHFDDSTPADPTKGMYDTAVEAFGPPPDMFDSDPKIYILIFDIGKYMTYTFDGYWNVYDEYTLADAMADGQRSNEVEIIYIDCDPTDCSSDVTLGTFVHEFQHMLHWNADPNEDTWVNEGCGEYAMHLCGYPSDLLENYFCMRPDTNLTKWVADPSPAIGHAKNYGKAKLFTIYLSEHYGGPGTISAWVAETANSVTGLNKALSARGYSETLHDIFPDWVIANYLDEPGIYGGKYYYDMIDFPNMTLAATHTGGMLPFSTTVENWGTDYIKFTTDPVPLKLLLNGQDTGDFYAQVVSMKSGAPADTIVSQIPLDAAQDGFINIPGFGTVYDEVILSVAASGSSGKDPADYTYQNAKGSSIPVTSSTMNVMLCILLGVCIVAGVLVIRSV